MGIVNDMLLWPCPGTCLSCRCSVTHEPDLEDNCALTIGCGVPVAREKGARLNCRAPRAPVFQPGLGLASLLSLTHPLAILSIHSVMSAPAKQLKTLSREEVAKV